MMHPRFFHSVRLLPLERLGEFTADDVRLGVAPRMRITFAADDVRFSSDVSVDAEGAVRYSDWVREASNAGPASGATTQPVSMLTFEQWREQKWAQTEYQKAYLKRADGDLDRAMNMAASGGDGEERGTRQAYLSALMDSPRDAAVSLAMYDALPSASVRGEMQRHFFGLETLITARHQKGIDQLVENTRLIEAHVLAPMEAEIVRLEAQNARTSHSNAWHTRFAEAETLKGKVADVRTGRISVNDLPLKWRKSFEDITAKAVARLPAQVQELFEKERADLEKCARHGWIDVRLMVRDETAYWQNIPDIVAQAGRVFSTYYYDALQGAFSASGPSPDCEIYHLYSNPLNIPQEPDECDALNVAIARRLEGCDLDSRIPAAAVQAIAATHAQAWHCVPMIAPQGCEATDADDIYSAQLSEIRGQLLFDTPLSLPHNAEALRQTTQAAVSAQPTLQPN